MYQFKYKRNIAIADVSLAFCFPQYIIYQLSLKPDVSVIL